MFKLPWDNKSGGGKKRGNFNKKYSKSFGQREMHKAVCDECGKPCEVPFKPTSGKPLFCRDCFDKDGSGSERSGERAFGGKNFKDFKSRDKGRSFDQNRPSGGDREQLKKMDEKLDKILKLLTDDADF